MKCDPARKNTRTLGIHLTAIKACIIVSDTVAVVPLPTYCMKCGPSPKEYKDFENSPNRNQSMDNSQWLGGGGPFTFIISGKSPNCDQSMYEKYVNKRYLRMLADITILILGFEKEEKN